MHATQEKFGYPETLIAEFEHWCVLLRPQQVTYGAMVLVAKSDAVAFGALHEAAFVELGSVVALLETRLRSILRYDKINYLMLMMVDPHVHFHVVPRYGRDVLHEGVAFHDHGWPGVPDLKTATDMTEAERNSLIATLRKAMV